MDPLQGYYEGLRDAPVPARLMAETPPEAISRRLLSGIGWALAGLALALAVAAIPTPTDRGAAATVASRMGARALEAAR